MNNACVHIFPPFLFLVSDCILRSYRSWIKWYPSATETRVGLHYDEWSWTVQPCILLKLQLLCCSALRPGATPQLEVCSYCILTGLPWHQPKILKIDRSVSTQRLPAALRAPWSILPRRCLIAAQHGAFLWEFKLFCTGMYSTIRFYAAVLWHLTPGIVSLQLKLAASEESAINLQSGNRLPSEPARALDEPLSPR